MLGFLPLGLTLIVLQVPLFLSELLGSLIILFIKDRIFFECLPIPSG